jgi:hypothetical protein
MLFPDREGDQTFSFGSPDSLARPYWTFHLAVVDCNGVIERLAHLHWSVGLFSATEPENVTGAFAKEYKVFSVELTE